MLLSFDTTFLNEMTGTQTRVLVCHFKFLLLPNYFSQGNGYEKAIVNVKL